MHCFLDALNMLPPVQKQNPELDELGGSHKCLKSGKVNLGPCPRSSGRNSKVFKDEKFSNILNIHAFFLYQKIITQPKRLEKFFFNAKDICPSKV